MRRLWNWIIVAGLALCATPCARGDDALPAPIAWRQSAFSIPFKVAPPSAGDRAPSEIRLYVSNTQGAKWDLAQAVPPQATGFTFRAQVDGEYWFQIRSADKEGNVQPELNGRPELRVIVDTTAPRLELGAIRGEAGEIRVNWQAADPLLNPESLKIEYQGTDGKWKPVAVDRPRATGDRTSTSGTMTWWPTDAPTNVVVKAEINDRAGNIAIAQAKTMASANRPDETAKAAPTVNGAQTKAVSASNSGAPEAKTTGPAWPANVATDPLNRTIADSTPPNERANEGGINPPIRDQAISAAAPSLGDPAARPDDAILPPGERPRMVNSRSFDLEYEVDGVGPAGIAKVELWGTRDGGRSWKSYGIDSDNRSPIRATVEGEGLYGFRIVVQSASGLGGVPPKPGDSPQMWVGVDLTKPTVKILGVEAGTGEHAGELLIRWQASDPAMASRPITLQFSDKPTGPWSIIAAGLENIGSYAWRPDNRAPDKIYLRIEARDEAGNVATYDTPEPTPLDRMFPAGRIREVRPAQASVHGFISGGLLK